MCMPIGWLPPWLFGGQSTSAFIGEQPYCSHYRLMNRGNISALSMYMTQSGKRRIFCCSKCERPFSEPRDTVFFDLRTPEEKVMMALQMLLVKVELSDISCVL